MGVGVVELAMAALSPVAVFVLWKRDVIRPGSLARRGRRGTGALPWWFFLVCAVMTLLVGGVLGGMVGAAVAEGRGDALRDAVGELCGSIGSVVVGVILLRLVGTVRQGGRAAEGFELGVRGRDVAQGVAAFLCIMPLYVASSMLAEWVSWMLNGTHAPEIAHKTLVEIRENPASLISGMLILGAVIGAPIAEELMFRVFLQSAVLGLVRRTWWAVFLTAAIFAAVHIGSLTAGAGFALVPLFVLGLGLGVAYERTRRPVVPMIVHMLFNATMTAVVVTGM